MRFVTISLGGWDTHGKNFETLKTKLLPQLDQTLSALIEDLQQRGMLDTTIVYCAGEFGRTPKINKNAGRDHWARSMAVRAGRRRLQARLRPRHHRRPGHGPGHRSLHAGRRVGHDLPAAWASTRTRSCRPRRGRPIQLFREGKVIEKLLA